MTQILAIDTATEACSAALLVGKTTLSRYEVAPQGHTRLILPMVESLLAEAGLSLNQLDAIAFGRGPGSFTGVRIGVGIAQGLALGADKPLLGISNLAVLAQRSGLDSQAEQVLCAIDARMGEVYYAAYRRQGEVMALQGEEAVLPPDAAVQQGQAMLASGGDWLGAGTGWAAYAEALSPLRSQLSGLGAELPDAEAMLPLALAAWQQGLACEAALAQPVYLRDKVTWKKLPGRE